jgi:endoglucanase
MIRPRRAVLVLAVLLVVAGLAAVRARHAIRRVLKARVAARRLEARTREPAPLEALRRLAASQVGYAPSFEKRFTSPAAFESFQVIDDASGAVVWTGGPPARRVETDILGPVRTVWIGDFSTVRRAGRYRLVADNGLTSHPFDVGEDVFERPLRAIQRWFYFQRAFTAIVRERAEGPWVHASDAHLAPPGIMKGWHDAGDLSLYGAATNVAIFWMLEAFSDFGPLATDDTNIPESGNGVPDLLDEARWGLEWLLSMQDGASGGFRGNTCADGPTRYGRTSPERAPPYEVAGPVTVATARAVGTLAYASAVFRPYDAAFAERCLRAARAGHRYLEAHRSETTDDPYGGCPAHGRTVEPIVGRHVRMYAAAGMLLATSEAGFRDEFERNLEEVTWISNYHRMNAFAARLYLRARAGDAARKASLRRSFRAMSDGVLADGARHPFEWATHYYWGSINNGFLRTGLFSIWSCIDDPSRARDCEQGLANVHYTFGRNYYQFCYVSGLPGVTRGMTSGFHHWLKTLDAKPRNFPGMVAGGPNEAPDPNDVSSPAAWPAPAWGYWGDPAMPREVPTPLDGRYTDNDSFSTNEPAVNFQGAALYSLYFARWLAQGRPAGR